ncbi:MAG: hypothetical protein ACRC1T_04695 [Clostridium chrysemydis]|uniref:hypothetical protein n=1 Tax=Clostridium chrysemydis TaxID=2665504 RepID=UPI003F37CFB8
MSRLIPFNRCIEIIREHEFKNGNQVEVTKKKVELFEKGLKETLVYDFYDKNYVNNSNIDDFENMYCICYEFWKKDNFLNNLHIKNTQKSKNDTYSYTTNSNGINDLTMFNLSLNIDIINLQYISNIFFHLGLFIRKIVKFAANSYDFNELNNLERKIEYQMTSLKSLISEPKYKYDCLNLSNYPPSIMMAFLSNLTFYSTLNNLSYQNQKEKLNEIIDCILVAKTDNYSISNLVEIFSENIDTVPDKEKCCKFIRENFDTIKKNLHEITSMFKNDDELKLGIIYLILKNNYYDNRNSFQNLFKKMISNKDLDISQKQFVINSFNFVATARNLLFNNTKFPDPKALYKKKLKIEKDILLFSTMFIEFFITKSNLKETLNATHLVDSLFQL